MNESQTDRVTITDAGRAMLAAERLAWEPVWTHNSWSIRAGDRVLIKQRGPHFSLWTLIVFDQVTGKQLERREYRFAADLNAAAACYLANGCFPDD